ncbi:hypothetical protein JCM10450v2_000282 [Rhodotorula kratochvilovae]
MHSRDPTRSPPPPPPPPPPGPVPRPFAYIASSSPSRALSRIWDRFSPPAIPSPFASSSASTTPSASPFPAGFLARANTPSSSHAPAHSDDLFAAPTPVDIRGSKPVLEQHDSASQLSFSLRRASVSAPRNDAWESPFRLPSLPWKGKDRERHDEDVDIDDMVDDEACFVDGWEGKVDFLVSLPSELALHILLLLDFHSVLACSLVSRSWRQLALDPLLWRELFHQNPRWHINPEAYRQAARETYAAQQAAAAAAAAAATSAAPSPMILLTPGGTSERERSGGYFSDRPVMPNLKRAASSFGRAGAKRIVTGADRVQAGGAVLGRKLSEIVGDLGGLSLVPAGANGALVPSASASASPSRAHSPERTTPTAARTPRGLVLGAGTPASPLLGVPPGPGQPSTSAVPTHAFASPPSAGLARASSSSALSSLASMSTATLTPRRAPRASHPPPPPPPQAPPATPGVSALPDEAEDALMAAAGLSLDWRRLFRDRWLLERRWETGKPSWSWFEGHADSVYCVQFDERKIVSGSRDQTIRIWDVASGTTTATLRGHEGSVLCLQYDDEVLISGSSDSRVVVWDLVGDEAAGRKRYEVVRTLVGHSMGVLDLCFDDKWIVSCSKDTTTRVWNRQTGELYRTLAGHRGPVNAVQLHGDRVLTASGDALMKLWDVHTGATLRTFTGHSRGLACVHWAPSGKEFVSSSNDKTIKLWNADTGECVRTFTGHTDLVRGLAWDEKSRRIVSGGYDRTTRVWDAETGEELHKFRSHSSLVFDVAFSASAIVSVSHDRRILLMDFGAGLDVSKFA